MNYKELMGLTTDELESRLGDLKEERFRLQIQHTSNQLESTALLKKIRKDIARVMTALRQKERGGAK